MVGRGGGRDDRGDVSVCGPLLRQRRLVCLALLAPGQGLVPTRSEQFLAFWRLAARDTALLAAVPLPLVGFALWLHV